MNDGVKILLDRMVTHPEEFVDATNLGATKWSGLLNYYDNVLTLEEKKAIEQGLLKIKRDKFTQLVMERILDEPVPVEIDPNTFTMKTVGRDPWGNAHEKYENALMQLTEEQLAQIKEILRNRLQQATTKKSK